MFRRLWAWARWRLADRYWLGYERRQRKTLERLIKSGGGRVPATANLRDSLHRLAGYAANKRLECETPYLRAQEAQLLLDEPPADHWVYKPAGRRYLSRPGLNALRKVIRDERRGRREPIVTTLSMGIAVLSACIAASSAYIAAKNGQHTYDISQHAEERAQRAGAIDAVWHLDGEWDSPRMLQSRCRAAIALHIGTPDKAGADIDRVLDHFELLAMLVHEHVLDARWAWRTYFEPLTMWAGGTLGYRKDVNKLDKNAWREMTALVDEVMDVERREGGHIKKMKAHAELVQEYFTDEATECGVRLSWAGWAGLGPKPTTDTTTTTPSTTTPPAPVPASP